MNDLNVIRARIGAVVKLYKISYSFENKIESTKSAEVEMASEIMDIVRDKVICLEEKIKNMQERMDEKIRSKS
jgi:hypothetical protein